MARVLVTGMSGVGKSTALTELARRGHRVVDTDYGGYSRATPTGHGRDAEIEQLWIPEQIRALLDEPVAGTLFVAGTVANQGEFYPRFDVVALLLAPVEVMLERLAARTTNPFGGTAADRRRILRDHAEVVPLLRATSTLEISTQRPVAEVADLLERAANGPPPGPHTPGPA